MKKALVLFVCAIVLASSLAALLAASVAGSGAPADMVRYVTADGDSCSYGDAHRNLAARRHAHGDCNPAKVHLPAAAAAAMRRTSCNAICSVTQRSL